MSNEAANVATIVTASQLSAGDTVNHKKVPAVVVQVKLDPMPLATMVDLMDPTSRFITRDVYATEVDLLWDAFFDRVSTCYFACYATRYVAWLSSQEKLTSCDVPETIGGPDMKTRPFQRQIIVTIESRGMAPAKTVFNIYSTQRQIGKNELIALLVAQYGAVTLSGTDYRADTKKILD
eukprot:1691836-Prymnesium_polylepis.1